MTEIECPDDNTFIAYTTDQSDRIFQIYVPILPEHIYGELNYKQIADEKFDPPLVGHRPVHDGRVGDRPVRPVRAQPQLLGQQGFPDEVVLQFFPDATDTMVQALKAGELDYVHGVNADQFKQLAADPDVHDRRRQGERLDAARVQHVRHRDRQHDRGRRPVHAGAARPGVPRRPRLRGRQARARRAGARRLRRRGHHQHPADPRGLARRADHAAHVRPRARQAEARRRGLRRSTATAGGWTRRATRSTSGCTPRTPSDDYAKVAQFIEEWYGELGHRRRRSSRSTPARSAS